MIADLPGTPAPPPPWVRTVAAAAVLVVLYLALDTAAAELVVVSGHPSAPAALAALLVGAALAVAALCSAASAGIDQPSMRAQVLGTSRPRRAIVPLLVTVVTIAVGAPMLVLLANGLGLRGGTELPHTHYPPELAALLAAESIVLAPWMEEVSMRGLLFTGLLRRFGFWPAALLSAFVWAALHRAPLVLIAFTVTGVALAWLRRRTGSVRWGIGVHGAWNTFAAAALLGWWAGFGIAVLAATMVLARRDLGGRPAAAVRRLLRGPGIAAAAVARRLPGRSPAGARAIRAGGVLLAAGVALEAADRYRLAGVWTDHGGRVAIAAGSVLLASAAAGTERWRVDRRAALAGVAGGLLGAAAHVATAAGAVSVSAADPLAYVLTGWWLWRVGAAGAGWTVRLGARVAALGLLLSVVPPVRSAAWFDASSVILLMVAACGLYLLGSGADRADPTPERIWPAVSAAVARRGWSDARWGLAVLVIAVAIAAVVISLPQPASGAALPAICAPRTIRVDVSTSVTPAWSTGRFGLTAGAACRAGGVIRLRASLAAPAGTALPPSLIGLAAITVWRGVVRPPAGSTPSSAQVAFAAGPRFCADHRRGVYTVSVAVIGGHARAAVPFVCR